MPGSRFIGGLSRKWWGEHRRIVISTPCTVELLLEFRPQWVQGLFMAKPPAKPKDSKKDIDQPSIRLPVNMVLPVSIFVKANDLDVETRKLNEIAELLWLPDTLIEAERNARIVRAFDLYESIKPRDGSESMLAAQMVGAHSAALECLRRAAVEGQTIAGRDMALKHAQKLMSLYAKQLETLNKHRGKGQQKVTVEHVNIEPGGQAIVGNVSTGGRSSSASQASNEYWDEAPLEEEMPVANTKNNDTLK